MKKYYSGVHGTLYDALMHYCASGEPIPPAIRRSLTEAFDDYMRGKVALADAFGIEFEKGRQKATLAERYDRKHTVYNLANEILSGSRPDLVASTPVLKKTAVRTAADLLGVRPKEAEKLYDEMVKLQGSKAAKL